MAHGEFSVCQFFENDAYEYVRRFVDAEEAVRTFQLYTNNPASLLGITKKVIITDGGDCISMEWQYGKGIVFPTNGDLKNAKKEDKA